MRAFKLQLRAGSCKFSAPRTVVKVKATHREQAANNAILAAFATFSGYGMDKLRCFSMQRERGPSNYGVLGSEMRASKSVKAKSRIDICREDAALFQIG